MNNSTDGKAIWISVSDSVSDSVKHSVKDTVKYTVWRSVQGSAKDYFQNKTTSK
jgi:hypothetical protein